MKAEELMIGDWLQHASGKCFQITRLDMWVDGSVHFACGHPHLWEYNNKFTPIPLTTEILEKNGFKKRDGRYQDVFYYYGDLDLRIDSRLEPCGYTLYGVYELPIKYVHELQHALKLCNIEKEIEL